MFYYKMSKSSISVLNKVEKDQLTFFKDMVEGHYMIKSIYTGTNNPPGKKIPDHQLVVDPIYVRDRNQALKELGLAGRKITELNYDNKMMFLFKILINSRAYTIQGIFERMNKSKDSIRPRLAFQKVLMTMKTSSKKKTKRKKKGTKGRKKGTKGRKKGTKGRKKGTKGKKKGTKGRKGGKKGTKGRKITRKLRKKKSSSLSQSGG